jgi:hypothetical protein
LSSGIVTRAQGVRLWREGAFGPRLRVWPTVAEYITSGLGRYMPTSPSRFVLRQRDRPAGGSGFCKYNIPPHLVPSEAWRAALALGLDIDALMVNEQAPDHVGRVQGELWTGVDRPWWCRLSTAPGQMREALAAGSFVLEGYQARLYLEQQLWSQSWARLLDLYERYPDHAIEFSVYSQAVAAPANNTLIWEVRAY